MGRWLPPPKIQNQQSLPRTRLTQRRALGPPVYESRNPEHPGLGAAKRDGRLKSVDASRGPLSHGDLVGGRRFRNRVIRSTRCPGLQAMLTIIEVGEFQ